MQAKYAWIWNKSLLSTHCLVHPAVISLEIVIDWKLSLTWQLRIILLAHWITKLPFVLAQEQNLLALDNWTWILSCPVVYTVFYLYWLIKTQNVFHPLWVYNNFLSVNEFVKQCSSFDFLFLLFLWFAYRMNFNTNRESKRSCWSMLRCSMNLPELGEFSFSDDCQRKINHITVCFTNTVSEVRLKFPQFDMNLAIALCSCQSKMQNLETNMYNVNFIGKLCSLCHLVLWLFMLIRNYKFFSNLYTAKMRSALTCLLIIF